MDRNHIDYKGRLVISDRAHLVVDALLEADSKNESDSRSIFIKLSYFLEKFLGTTKRGIGPTYSAKSLR